ncbi:helix-turn-helix domain-containing protein (plasmid) [Bacillus mycoides]|nr:helix-turn-helix domain-containing protein [Bacillus mycoides]
MGCSRFVFNQYLSQNHLKYLKRTILNLLSK